MRGGREEGEGEGRESGYYEGREERRDKDFFSMG
jgi:hypothetical protein